MKRQVSCQICYHTAQPAATTGHLLPTYVLTSGDTADMQHSTSCAHAQARHRPASRGPTSRLPATTSKAN